MTSALFQDVDIVRIDERKNFLVRVADRDKKEALKEECPGMRMASGRKLWLVPGTSEYAAVLKASGIPLSKEARELAEALAGIEQDLIERSGAHNADIEIIGFGKEPFPFQRAGISYAVAVKRTIIGDEMGLGKTIQGLGAAYVAGAFPLLVITPASNKYNWFEDEIPKCLPNQTVILADKDVTDFTLSLADVVVTNYEQLVGYREVPKLGGGFTRTCWKDADKKEPVLSPLAEKLKQVPFRAVICDEAHYLKSNDAARTLCALEVGASIEYKFLLTGTPMLNRPIELYSLLKFLGLHNHFGGYWHFQQRYCALRKGYFGMDNKVNSKTIELNRKMRSLCYLRRKKEEVLKDLPSKLRTSYAVEITNRAEYQHAEDDLVEWVKKRVLKDKAFLDSLAGLDGESRHAAIRERQHDKAEAAERGKTMVLITALKRLVAEGKLKPAFDWIDNFLEQEGKLVVFAMHQSILDALLTRYPDAVSITSEQSGPERQKNVRKFQEDERVRLLVGAMGPNATASPAGLGHTLTAASNTLFLELGWTPGHLSQCEDRCHRIGQLDNVTCHYLLGRGTIDQKLAEIIESKRNVAAQVEDGDEEATGDSIMDELTDWLASR
jgi:SWI/SNF-related matrix-associated actin-dependent regulator of chromatin subfamily A-like protein 1